MRPLVPQDLRDLLPDLRLLYQLIHPNDDSIAPHAIVVRLPYHVLLALIAHLRKEVLGEGPRRFQMHCVEAMDLAAGSIDDFFGCPGRQRHTGQALPSRPAPRAQILGREVKEDSSNGHGRHCSLRAMMRDVYDCNSLGGDALQLREHIDVK
jgi:hypothetical protein